MRFFEPYIKVNTVFGLIIVLIIIYSAVFSAEKQNHPVPSFYSEISGQSTISSGLSRSFSEIIRGDFAAARELNKHGIRIFFFFVIQLFLRIIYSLIDHYFRTGHKYIIISDCVISVVLFVFCFWPFLTDIVMHI